MNQEQFSNIISTFQKTITIKVNEGTENEEIRSFITNKFKTMEGLEVSLIVHKEILSLLPTDITQGFDVRALSPVQFIDSLVKLFSKTYTQDNQLCSNIDDAFKGKNAYAFLMPLALEVIEFNGFFTLLGLESTFRTTIEKIKSQMLLMQILSELETSENNLRSLQILNQQEQTEQDQTSGILQTNSEENKTKKSKKSNKSLKTS